MASVRVLAKAFKDPRFVILGKQLGTTRFDARGRMEELWAYCTERNTYFIDAEIIDVLVDFDGFCEIILKPNVNLAERSDKGIRIKGTKGEIEWLATKRKNGKKGGRPKKPKVNPDKSDTKPIGFQNENPLSLTLSTSLAPTLSTSPVKENTDLERDANESREVDALPAVKPDSTATLIGLYCDAFKARYGTNPAISGKDAGIAKRLLKDFGIARATAIVGQYLKMNEAFFMTKRHDLATLAMNLNAIVVHLETGKSITRFDAQSAESKDFYVNQMERVKRGEI